MDKISTQYINKTMIQTPPPQATLYRIGAVSKLSGVPVPTLRIWQTRYQAFSPATSQGQHRLYNDDDLRKAVWLRALTQQGHAIRLIARLDNAQLQHMLQSSADMGRMASQPLLADDSAYGQRPSAWGVVGQRLATRLESSGFQSRRRDAPLPIQQVWADLDEAQSAPVKVSLDVLMVLVNNLSVEAAQKIEAVSQKFGVRRTVVLYGFAQKQALALLSKASCLVHRNTLDDALLAEIVQSACPTPVTHGGAWGDLSRPVPPRQYSDAVLQRVVNIPSQVLCECPRHVAELIGQLGRFEDYSRECQSQNTKDRQLHTQLNTMAASARALFEEALHMVAVHEGISLQEPS